MKRFLSILLLLCCLCGAAAAEGTLTPGTQTQRGFINDNVLHSEIGDIHFSSYIPESYDGSEPYALFVTLPGCIFRASARTWWRISALKPSTTTTK